MEPVSMIFAALVFEYVNVQDALHNMKKSIVRNGTLVVVLQEPTPNTVPVTHTPFESLKRLSPIMNLIQPKDFVNNCKR